MQVGLHSSRWFVGYLNCCFKNALGNDVSFRGWCWLSAQKQPRILSKSNRYNRKTENLFIYLKIIIQVLQLTCNFCPNFQCNFRSPFPVAATKSSQDGYFAISPNVPLNIRNHLLNSSSFIDQAVKCTIKDIKNKILPFAAVAMAASATTS